MKGDAAPLRLWGRMKKPGPLATVDRAIAGDAEALDALWREHRGWLAAVLVAHMSPTDELDDLLQEVALAVVRTIHSLNSPHSLRPWLRRVAMNTARSAIRRAGVASRNGMVRRGSGQDVDLISDSRDAAVDGAVRRTIQLVRDLPERYREPLLLKSVRGLTQRQIADVLELPVKTVETRLLRARRMLRSHDDSAPGFSRGASDKARPAELA